MKRWGFLMVLSACSLYGQWEPDKRITNYPNYLDYGSFNNAWTIAVQDTMVHIVWEHRSDATPGEPGKLYYIRSTDCGNNFDPDKQLTTRNSHMSSIAVRDTIVHVAYDDWDSNKVHYIRSLDNGAIWGPYTQLTSSGYSSITVQDSIVHLTWARSVTEIYYRRSVDNGATWEVETKFTNDPAISYLPSIAAHNSMVHVVWEDHRVGVGIYHKCSADNGVSWSPFTRLDDTGGTSSSPSIAVRDSIVHVVWSDYRHTGIEIYYKRSVDNGLSWGPDTRLTNFATSSRSPSIAVCDSMVHIVWSDDRDGNFEIYYNQSSDYGTNWAGDERLTFDAIASNYVSIACTKCPYDVHIAWTDERDDNREIYYKRHECEFAGIEEDKKLRVKSLELSAYPNPSFGNALIKYELPEKASIRLGLYDISGRMVKTLYSGTQEKGYHTINVSRFIGIPTGIYFIRLDTDNYKATRKLTIIR